MRISHSQKKKQFYGYITYWYIFFADQETIHPLHPAGEAHTVVVHPPHVEGHHHPIEGDLRHQEGDHHLPEVLPVECHLEVPPEDLLVIIHHPHQGECPQGEVGVHLLEIAPQLDRRAEGKIF